MRRSNFNQIFWGLVIIVIGVLFLAQNLGYIQDYSFWKYLPALLIILGLYQLFVNQFRAWVGPLLITLIGTFLLLATLNVITWATFGSMIWPTILILIGVSIILHRGESNKNFEASSKSQMNVFSTFSEQNRKVTSGDFKNAEVTAIFGGSKLDLRDASISQPPAYIQTTTMFGGVEIFVPSHWDVRINTVAFFGGSSDKRREVTPQKDTPDLIVTGTVFFGGLDIKP
ncbi:MAG: cell wall-active antibiotics response protein [Anaerolineaceae bacterium]|nr:cell wall-active antibiotics response protein [Anaerolineaceae bacterium]